MKIQERSYNSKMLRPKPVLHVEADGSIVIVATSWGQPEHAQKAVEEIAKVAGGEKAAKAVEKGYSDASNHIASRVRGAWDELNDRLATRRKPKLPPHMQAMVDSAAWRTMKQHPVGQKVATGAENVLYNLSRRYEAFSASWEDKFSKAKKKRKRRED